MHDCCICQPAAFWRRRIGDRVGPFDETLNYAMDYDYWLRLDRTGGCIQHIHDFLAASRQHPATKTLTARRRIYFTGIPFFSYGYDFPDRYGAEESFHLCRGRYEGLYGETVEEARKHGVSVELPLPAEQKTTAFGLGVRSFYDFADVEEAPYRLGLLVGNLAYEAGAPSCPQVYRTAYVGSRNRKHIASAGTHFLYPCLGPLAAVDFSTRTTFDFPDSRGFLSLWNHPVFVRLRRASRSPNLSPVCDACRGMDSRDPQNFAVLDKLLKEWEPATLIPAEQLTLRRREGA